MLHRLLSGFIEHLQLGSHHIELHADGCAMAIVLPQQGMPTGLESVDAAWRRLCSFKVSLLSKKYVYLYHQSKPFVKVPIELKMQ
jgi:hypothetical protein